MTRPKPDLAYLFGLPPAEAISYLKGKGYTFGWDWQDVWQEAHTKAFTVAKAMRLDVLQDIHSELIKAKESGTTFRDFQKSLQPMLEAKGWWGRPLVGDGQGGAEVVQLGSPWRLRTIFETNMQTAFEAGNYKQNMENAADRPWWMYSAVGDKRTRPAHAALNGLVFRFDDPFWQTHHPPNGFRCRCSVRALDNDGYQAKLKAGEVALRSTTGQSPTTTLRDEDRLVSKKTGVMEPVTVLKTTDRLGGTLIMAPDAGWNYNPGRAWTKPFTPVPYDPDTPGSIKTIGGALHAKRPLEELPVKPLTKDMLLPSHQQSGWSETEYVNRFLGEFGAAIGKPAVFRDVINDAVVISSDLFMDRTKNKLKVFRADREIYLKLLADTIKDPAEIWLTPVEKEGRKRLCKRYIGLYQEGSRMEGGIVIFDIIDGQWQGTTVFSPEKMTYLDKQRSGAQLYTKK